MVREMTAEDGEEGRGLVAFLVRVYRGEEKIKVGEEEFSPTLRDRLQATQILLERGWGRENVEEEELRERIKEIREELQAQMSKDYGDATTRLREALADEPAALQRALAALAGGGRAPGDGSAREPGSGDTQH